MSKKDTQSILDEFKNAPTEEKVQTGRKLKVGIIGTGWIADAHAQKYKMMEDVEVVALADLVPGKAEKFAEKWEFTTLNATSPIRSFLTPKQISTPFPFVHTTEPTQNALFTLLRRVFTFFARSLCA